MLNKLVFEIINARIKIQIDKSTYTIEIDSVYLKRVLLV